MYLVGEGNFTFTLALVTLRGSWNGIITSCLEENRLLETFSETKLAAIQWCIKNERIRYGNAEIDKARVFDRIEEVLSVKKPKRANVQSNVDCRKCKMNAPAHGCMI